MTNVKLNLRGLEEVATRGATAAVVAAAAEQVAAAARSAAPDVEGVPGAIRLPVTVETGTTSSMRVNRAKAWVNLAHPAGMAAQAKHGTLTKAASAAGLKVKGY